MPLSSRLSDRGFSLLEVLITLAILMVIVVVVLQFFNEVDRAWKSASTDPFVEAQNAFETVARNLAAATLETYQDYADANGAFRASSSFAPDHLARRSDLAFVCGPGAGASGLLATSKRTTTGSGIFFLAPQGYTQTFVHEGMGHLLNAMGYFVEFGDDDAAPGFISPPFHSWRWRLKQVLQPAESLQIFATTSSTTWIQGLVPINTPLSVLAENVVTLIVLPERAVNDAGDPLAPVYSYDSRDTGNRLTLHQIPPRMRVILVAMDPTSAERLAAENGANPPQLVPANFFQKATQLSTDLTALDISLTAQKIGHRIFQREILLPSSSWSNTPSP